MMVPGSSRADSAVHGLPELSGGKWFISRVCSLHVLNSSHVCKAHVFLCAASCSYLIFNFLATFTSILCGEYENVSVQFYIHFYEGPLPKVTNLGN